MLTIERAIELARQNGWRVREHFSNYSAELEKDNTIISLRQEGQTRVLVQGRPNADLATLFDLNLRCPQLRAQTERRFLAVLEDLQEKLKETEKLLEQRKAEEAKQEKERLEILQFFEGVLGPANILEGRFVRYSNMTANVTICPYSNAEVLWQIKTDFTTSVSLLEVLFQKKGER